MSLVAIDTHVLTWVVQALHQKQGPIHQKEPATTPAEIALWEERKAQAASLVQELQETKTIISIPSMVLGELLCAVPTSKHPAVLDVLAKGFVIHPFDLPAAMTFAELHKLRHGDGTIDALKAHVPPPTREKVKADLVVVATAVRWKADRIYSHDTAVKALAQGKIRVVEMPPKNPVQTTLTALLGKPKP